MAWMPLLPRLRDPRSSSPPRRRALVAALALAVAAAAVNLTLWQVRFFNRYKGTDLEDQARNAAYLSRCLDAYSSPAHRVAVPFLYGFQHYPIEVIWSLPRDGAASWPP